MLDMQIKDMLQVINVVKNFLIKKYTSDAFKTCFKKSHPKNTKETTDLIAIKILTIASGQSKYTADKFYANVTKKS